MCVVRVKSDQMKTYLNLLNFVHVVLLLANQFHYIDLTSTSSPSSAQPLVEDEVVVMLGPSLLDFAC